MKINRDRFARKKGQEWVDWLNDSELEASVDMPKSAQPVARRPVGDTVQRPSPAPPAAKPGATISINLHLPRIRFLALPNWRGSLPQIRRAAVITGIVVVSGIGARFGLEQLATHSGSKQAANGAVTAGNSKPSFTPVLPKGNADKVSEKSIYDQKRQLYTYEDQLLKSTITLSEQPVPPNLKNNPAAVREISRGIGADMTIKTAFGDAYVATSENKSSQRLVMVRNDVLIFIETLKTYDEETWKFYLESLR